MSQFHRCHLELFIVTGLGATHVCPQWTVTGPSPSEPLGHCSGTAQAALRTGQDSGTV